MLTKLKTFLSKKRSKSEKQPAEDMDEIVQTKDIILALQHTTYHPFDFDPMPDILALQTELELLLHRTFAETEIDADNGDIFDEWLSEKFGDISVKMNQNYLTHRQLLFVLFQDYARQTSSAKYELLPELEKEEEKYLNEQKQLESLINVIEGRNNDV